MAPPVALVHATLADTDRAGRLRLERDATLTVAEGRILGRERVEGAREVDVEGRLIVPGLVDCHTHLVHAGSRAGSFFASRLGDPWGRPDGSILETVAATAEASDEELLARARGRLRTMAACGVRTVEAKSGYGLEPAAEERLLRLARALDGYAGVEIVSTYLGAHALPPAWRDDPRGYVAAQASALARFVAEGLVDLVDCWIDPKGFDAASVAPLLEEATRLGVPVRAHVDQFGDARGAAAVAPWRPTSLDHAEFLDPEAVPTGTVVVLLPFAYLHTGTDRLPPVAGLRERRVSLAVATDCNPGTAPITDLLLAGYLAVALFGLTPEEVFAGVTRHAAAALGRTDLGHLEVGARAAPVMFEVEHPFDLFAGAVRLEALDPLSETSEEGSRAPRPASAPGSTSASADPRAR